LLGGKLAQAPTIAFDPLAAKDWQHSARSLLRKSHRSFCRMAIRSKGLEVLDTEAQRQTMRAERGTHLRVAESARRRAPNLNQRSDAGSHIAAN